MKNFKLFLWVVLVQVFILNNVQFSGYINPYYYLIFILTIHPKTSKSGILVWSFILGLCIDVFSNSYGIHAFASVLVAYIQIMWTSSKLNNRDEKDDVIRMEQFSIKKFIFFASNLIFIHHFVLFFLESFSIYDFFYVLEATILSSILTMILLIIHKIIIIKKA